MNLNKRISIPIILIIIVGGVILSYQYYISSETRVPEQNTEVPNQIEPVAEKICEVYTYQDKYFNGSKHCLNIIKIKGIYFLAKDQTNEFMPSWFENMKDILNKTKDFYETQFNNKITIIIDESQIVYGDKDAYEYKSAYEVIQEIINKLKLKVVPDYFSALTIFYNSNFGSYGGGGMWDSPDNNGSITTNPSFWLDKELLCTITNKTGTDCSGYINTGHEFGHSLGIPHPWDMDVNKDSKGIVKNPNFSSEDFGNIMSYASRNLLSEDPNNPFGNYYIMDEAKRKMIVQ